MNAPRNATLSRIAEFEEQIRALDGFRSFFDPCEFPWVSAVEAHWPAMRAELDAVLSALELLPGFEEIQVEEASVTNDRRWKVLPFFAYGHWVEQNLERCPATARALALIPELRVAMFSIFEGGKTLPEHRGPYGGVLRYHLALKVPTPERQCGICVAGELRHWFQGESLVFDDAHRHTAWNHSTENRVVLFVDFDRPLPPGLRERNESIIRGLGAEPFITDAVQRWRAWEAVYGERLSAACRNFRPA